MCYKNINIQTEIITKPGSIQVDEELVLNANEKDHSLFYGRRYYNNEKELLLDDTWKEYSQNAGPGCIMYTIPEFTHLHVPAQLFYTFGVDAWFQQCFPNCKVTFWKM
jgi:hypothetical protein